MEVYKPGTKVSITCPDGNKLPAVVDKVTIGYNGASYTLVWYSGNNRQENSYHPSEFEVDNPNGYKQKVGFHNAI